MGMDLIGHGRAITWQQVVIRITASILSMLHYGHAWNILINDTNSGCSKHPSVCQNDALCIQLALGYFFCQCQPGKIGPYCEFDDECVTKPCHPNATCVASGLNGKTTCICPSGFSSSQCKISDSMTEKHERWTTSLIILGIVFGLMLIVCITLLIILVRSDVREVEGNTRREVVINLFPERMSKESSKRDLLYRESVCSRFIRTFRKAFFASNHRKTNKIYLENLHKIITPTTQKVPIDKELFHQAPINYATSAKC